MSRPIDRTAACSTRGARGARRAREARDARKSGFSLIDALVAIAILGVSLTILFRAISGDLVRMARAETTLRAAVLAQNLLHETGLDRPLRPGERSGREGEVFAWRVAIAPYEIAPPDDAEMRAPTGQGALFEITVEVNWRAAARPQRYILKTLALEDSP